MKFTKTGARSSSYAAKVNLLVEALPWIKHTTGKTVLIKYGGSAMENPELMAQVMTDIVLLKIIGMKPIIVHGGGKDISAAFEKSGMPVEFKDGLRVTPDDAMELVRMVLVGSVNRRLVDAINVHGHLAVGVSGGDGCTIRATQLDPELGRVGEVTSIDPTYLEHLINDDYIPIVASVAATTVSLSISTPISQRAIWQQRCTRTKSFSSPMLMASTKTSAIKTPLSLPSHRKKPASSSNRARFPVA